MEIFGQICHIFALLAVGSTAFLILLKDNRLRINIARLPRIFWVLCNMPKITHHFFGTDKAHLNSITLPYKQF